MAGLRPDIERFTEVIDGENVQVIKLNNFSLADHLQSLANPKIKTKSKTKSKPEPEPDAYLRPPTSGCPVNGLPNELLSYIFTIGYEAQIDESDDDDDDDEDDDDEEEEEEEEVDDDDDSDSDYDSTVDSGSDDLEPEFQVLVSHVCQRWRNVALETPTLWTHVDFTEGPPFDKSRAYIARSKESPLDIDIDCTVPDDVLDLDEDEDEDEDKDATPAPDDPQTIPASSDGRVSPSDLPLVRDLLLPHVPRWRQFEFMVNDFKIMHTILSTLAAAGPAPQLKALLLYHYEDVEAYDVFRPAELRAPALAPFGGIAPALTHVALWGVHVDWDACHFLSGLDELELAYHTYDVRPSYPTFLSILRASPALRTLTLCLSGPAGTPQDWPDPAPDPVVLPSVENLVLAFHELPYITALLRRLHFPSVTSLALDFDDEDYGPLLDQLAQAPPATGARPLLEGLRALKLSGMQCGDAAVARFYAALPNLTTLNLNCRHLPPAFVTQLAPAGADADADDPTKLVLPSLEMLTTTGVRGVEMRTLVEARRARPLKRVLMEREDDVAEADEAWLRARVDEFGFFEGSEDESEDDELALEDVDSDSDEGE